MKAPEMGICCAGCPHRAAYLACRAALGRGRGRVLCGDAGCAQVGPMHPAATTCPGGEGELLDRYRIETPQRTAAGEPGSVACIHFIPDALLMEPETADALSDLAGEGISVVLAILASSADFATRPALEGLADRARALGAQDAIAVDPFDAENARSAVCAALAAPGVHAVIFSSPCTRLLDLEPLGGPCEVDPFACIGCHRCKQVTGCPALNFAPPAYRIDADACAGCDLCAAQCRTHVIYSPRARLAIEDRARLRWQSMRP